MNGTASARHTFLGLDADAWADAEGLPAWSDMTQGEVTVEDVKVAVVAMLRRLDSAPSVSLTPPELSPNTAHAVARLVDALEEMAHTHHPDEVRTEALAALAAWDALDPPALGSRRRDGFSDAVSNPE